jgi:hypothetical protein
MITFNRHLTVRQSLRQRMTYAYCIACFSLLLLQVLDARDPLGSRASAVENAVLSRPGKRLILVLNKVSNHHISLNVLLQSLSNQIVCCIRVTRATQMSSFC